MFPVPFELVIFYFAFISGCMFGLGVIFALLLNRLLRTPAKQYLVSSGLIAVVVNLVATLTLLFTLSPLRWSNGKPQDMRTALWEYLPIVAGAAGLICVAGWQFAVRVRRRSQRTSLRCL